MADREEIIQRIQDLLDRNRPFLQGQVSSSDPNKIVLPDGTRVTGRALNTPIGNENDVVYIPQTSDQIPRYFYPNSFSPVPLNRDIRNLRRAAPNQILGARVQLLYVVWTDNFPTLRYAEAIIDVNPSFSWSTNERYSILINQTTSEYAFPLVANTTYFPTTWYQSFTNGSFNILLTDGVYANEEIYWFYLVNNLFVTSYSETSLRNWTSLPRNLFSLHPTDDSLGLTLYWEVQSLIESGSIDPNNFENDYLRTGLSATFTTPSVVVYPPTLIDPGATVTFEFEYRSIIPTSNQIGAFMHLNPLGNRSYPDFRDVGGGWSPTSGTQLSSAVYYITSLAFTSTNVRWEADVIFSETNPGYYFRWFRDKDCTITYNNYNFTEGTQTGPFIWTGNTNSWQCTGSSTERELNEFTATDLAFEYNIDAQTTTILTGAFSAVRDSTRIGTDVRSASRVFDLNNDVGLQSYFNVVAQFSNTWTWNDTFSRTGGGVFSTPFSHGVLAETISISFATSTSFSKSDNFTNNATNSTAPQNFVTDSDNLDVWYNSVNPEPATFSDSIQSIHFDYGGEDLFSIQSYNVDFTSTFNGSARSGSIIARGNNQMLVIFNEIVLSNGSYNINMDYRLGIDAETVNPRLDFAMASITPFIVPFGSPPNVGYDRTNVVHETYRQRYLYEGRTFSLGSPWLTDYDDTGYLSLSATSQAQGNNIDVQIPYEALIPVTTRQLEFAGMGYTETLNGEVAISSDCYYSNADNSELLTINTDNTIMGRPNAFGNVTYVGNDLTLTRVQFWDVHGRVSDNSGYPTSWTRTFTRSWNDTLNIFQNTTTYSATAGGTRLSIVDWIGEEFYFYSFDFQLLFTFTLNSVISSPTGSDSEFDITGTVTNTQTLNTGAFFEQDNAQNTFDQQTIVSTKNVLAAFVSFNLINRNGAKNRTALNGKTLYLTYNDVADAEPEQTFVHRFAINNDGNITFSGEVEALLNAGVAPTQTAFSRQYNGVK